MPHCQDISLSCHPFPVYVPPISYHILGSCATYSRVRFSMLCFEPFPVDCVECP
nr:MAG TPA: hypothetical protein [Caudoviricetes sp.]